MPDERNEASSSFGPEETQLKRILDSPVFGGGEGFVRADRLAALLKYMVEQTLSGVTITDTYLLLHHYDMTPADLEEDPSRARVNVRRLRAKLSEYYALYGQDDPIIIDIPMRRHDLKFLSNLNSSAQKEVRRGLYYVGRETPGHIRQALIHFENVIRDAPDFSEGYAAKSNALLTMTLHALSADQGERFEAAEQAARKAITLDSGSWRGHACLGGIHMLRHQWHEADQAFANAQKIGPLEIDSIDSFGPYLLSRGRYKEAENLARRYEDEGVDNVVLLRRAAIYYYALRDFNNAERVLRDTVQMEKSSWLSHLFLALVYLALKRPDDALANMLSADKFTDANLWPGFRIMCFYAAGMVPEAESKTADLYHESELHYVPPMQLALASLAASDLPEAITYLSQACEEGDPFTVGLHLWAFLDPLRRFPEFTALLRRRGLPLS